MKVSITKEAAEDIVVGYVFYEMQSPGLGDYFESSIIADIQSLIVHQGIHETHFGHYFRKIARRFPYAIYYTIEADSIIVHAALDTRRDPVRAAWRLDE